MKTKFFTLLSLSVLTLIIFMGVGSAVSLNPITVSSIPTSVSQDDGSFTFTFNLTNTGVAGNLNYSASTVTNTGATITFDDPSIADGSTTPVTETITATVTFPFSSTSPISGTVDVLGQGASTHKTLAFSVSMTPSVKPQEVQECVLTANAAGADNSDLQLKIEDVKVTGFGDEYEWFPFDEVEIEISVENDNNADKMKEIVVGWGLYNTETEEWYFDEEENDFKLIDGDEKTLFFTLNLDEDIDELMEGDYIFYVWANAVLDADAGEVDLCASEYEDVEIVVEDDFVILSNIKYLETVSCGTSVQLTADIWNIGSEDQEDVLVAVYNKELGINEKVTLDIDAYEDEKLDVLIDIPTDAEEGDYILEFSVLDDYGDIFENSNDDKTEFQVHLQVEGNCINEPKAGISADLESEAKAGKELVVRVTVVNTGKETSTFEINLANYVNWADLESIVPESITLDAGESEDVLITLKVNSDVSGNQNFEVVLKEGTNILSQQVSVMIEESGFGGLGKITGGLISESNWPIWTIGAVNIILVFIIILVALKMSRK